MQQLLPPGASAPDVRMGQAAQLSRTACTQKLRMSFIHDHLDKGYRLQTVCAHAFEMLVPVTQLENRHLPEATGHIRKEG